MREPVNILMVDDQPGKLLSYETILGRLEKLLSSQIPLGKRFDYLMKTDIAVILMDVSMPELDGSDLRRCG